jgi:hypothetical protein
MTYEVFTGACGADTVELRRRMKVSYGLRPARNHEFYPCPSWLVDRRCTDPYQSGCLFAEHRRGGGDYLLDHARGWRDERGGKVITAEPYHVYSDELASLGEKLRGIGVEFRIEANSPWFPGHTKLLILRAVGDVPKDQRRLEDDERVWRYLHTPKGMVR